MAGGGVGATPIEAGSTHQAADQAPLPDACERFLYLRYNLAGHIGGTTSLVLVRVTRDGFDSRAVYSEQNLDVGWRALGVCNRKLYGIKMGLLLTVDLETGTAEEVDWSIDSSTWSDRRLYAFVRQGEGPSLLRVYDAETEAYRNIASDPPWVVLPRSSSVPALRVSPDHKWLAYFCRSDSPIFSPTYHLCLIAVDGGTIKASKISVGAREFGTGAGMAAPGPPFCWLDSKTLLVVRDVSKKPWSEFYEHAADAEMILARVDVDADRITDICRLPQFGPRIYEPFFRNVHPGEMPRLVLGRLGQYRIDLVERRLVEDAEIGGGYSYKRGERQADSADELRFKDKLLEVGMVIPELAVSPDGRRVAWHARPRIRPPYDADASKIRLHDAGSGRACTVAAAEWIPGAWDTLPESFEGNLLWISTRDLTPMSQTNPPAGWERFSPQPYLGGGRSHRAPR
jgi:hypothetical protein